MVKLLDSIYKLTKVCPVSVIPQVRTITRYGTGSVILFNCAESPVETISVGDYSLRFVKEFRTDRLTRHVP